MIIAIVRTNAIIVVVRINVIIVLIRITVIIVVGRINVIRDYKRSYIVFYKLSRPSRVLAQQIAS